MRVAAFVASTVIISGLSLSTASASAEILTALNDKQPPLPKPHPPQTPLSFTRVGKENSEILEIRYAEPGRMIFKYSIKGPCKRVEKGTATIKRDWWLGAETDENSEGEAIAVQEYVYNKNDQCQIYIRIDETDWAQASIMEAPDCNNGCASSGQPLRRKESNRLGLLK